MVALLSLLWGCSAAPPNAPAAGAPGADRPNIVLIVADDLGWSDVSSYGLDRVPTPNIDRIAADGVAFTNGYVTSPACAPSRAALMTGRYPQSFGFEYNMFPQDGTRGLPQSETTIAETLDAAGYRTGLVGKWHQGVQDHQYPTNRGFDEFFGFLSGTITYIDPAAPGIVNARPPETPETTPRDAASSVYTGADRQLVDNYNRYLTHELTREAVRFIETGGEEPFFLYLAHHAPHRPFQVPQRYYDMFADEPDHDRRVYMAMIAAMDEGIGDVLDALEARGLRENTIVIFTSDNGCPSRFGVCDCSAPINAGKFTHLEGGIRVPFLMSWPNGIDRRGFVDEPVSLLDIFPTLAAVADAPGPAALDGIDLVAALGDDMAPARERALFWRQRPVSALRDGDWKFVRAPNAMGRLYNLGDDPAETADLSSAFPDRTRAMDDRLSLWERDLPEPSWPSFFERPVEVCGRESYAVY
ncbi:sulfatase-like hydrolase/transferase [Parasphingopyxis sp.]|uniref:sulfatase-like hydrolase/transferase n=1 Tax=Parasphingopyxis sp. TaxID=1920299 RepID=UPI003F9FC06F